MRIPSACVLGMLSKQAVINMLSQAYFDCLMSQATCPQQHDVPGSELVLLEIEPVAWDQA